MKETDYVAHCKSGLGGVGLAWSQESVLDQYCRSCGDVQNWKDKIHLQDLSVSLQVVDLCPLRVYWIVLSITEALISETEVTGLLHLSVQVELHHILVKLHNMSLQLVWCQQMRQNETQQGVDLNAAQCHLRKDLGLEKHVCHFELHWECVPQWRHRLGWAREHHSSKLT